VESLSQEIDKYLDARKFRGVRWLGLLLRSDIDRILAAGAERARALAAPVMADVRRIVGFWNA
jgi:hypothetical protein